MFETIRNAFKVKDVRNKILWTILFVVIYRLGCYITVPGLQPITIEEGTTSIMGLLNSITGSALSQGTIFSLGISPYINASIIVQLLTVAIPALERWSKEGEEGKAKINKITRWVTFGLAIVSAVGIYLTFKTNYSYVNTAWLNPQWSEFFAGLDATGNVVAGGVGEWILGIYIVTMLVGGSMLCMWIGERITEYGVSNGISMIIFVGIVATATQAIEKSIINSQWLGVIIFLLELTVIFAFIVWVDGAERKIKVTYAKQVKGNKMYGGQSTFIPVKVNGSGVMPLIFAYALMSFVPMLVQTFGWDTGAGSFGYFWNTYMTATNGHWVGTLVYNLVLAVFIFVFAYFYSQIQFNPVEISRNIQNNGGTISGRRPGRETAEYLQKVISRITLWGALFLAIIAFVPSILFSVLGWAGVTGYNPELINSFSATGMMICVSVALEFNKSLENQLLMRMMGSSSKGFLR